MAQSLNSRKFVRAVGGKALTIPDEGWTARSFALHGGPMILALARVAKITQRRNAPVIAAKARALFKKQMDEVIRRVLEWSRIKAGGRPWPSSPISEWFIPNRKPSPQEIVVELPQNAELWAEAMNEVFQEAGIEATTELMPTIQSTMAQGYSRTSILLGQEPDEVSRIITTQSRTIARRIVNISETTRRRITNVIVDCIESGFDVVETAAAVESAAPQIYGNRALTIARTELNNAWTKGAVAAMQESSTISHVSVIGCEAREDGSPQYRGESTCNIEDVPIFDADSLEFHINHTGNIVPSRFRNEDGTAADESDRPQILDDWAQRAEDQADEGAAT